MMKPMFPAYAFLQQKCCPCRNLVKPRSMKLCHFISRLQELNAHLGDFSPDIDDKEAVPLPVDEIMDIIYHSMPITWKNKMIEQGFN